MGVQIPLPVPILSIKPCAAQSKEYILFMNWKPIPQQSKASLEVLTINGKEKGFIFKPKDTKTDKNAWRVHLGIGESNQFIGHSQDKKGAKDKLLAFV